MRPPLTTIQQFLVSIHAISWLVSPSLARLDGVDDLGAQQLSFQVGDVPYWSHGVGLSEEQLHDLAAVPSDRHVSFKHPAFPNHSARFKKANFCDPTVNTYTGYIDIGVKHLFFYFFESRNDPSTDDVLLWTNGGPGSSSAIGLLTELGPCNIVSENETEFNPYSWNSNASIFFIDQPVGVGFSYADFGDPVRKARKTSPPLLLYSSKHLLNTKGERSISAGNHTLAVTYLFTLLQLSTKIKC